MLARLIAIVFLGVSIIAVSIFTMIYGWGIQPVNWGWITLGYLWAMFAPLLAQGVAK